LNQTHQGVASGLFGAEGALARVLPDYEERAGQAQLSEAVGSTLREGGVLLAEAGTGTGKTLAYLAPAVELGRRCDLDRDQEPAGAAPLQGHPLLARALGRDLSVAVMKGRGNYLCLLRFRSFTQAGSFRRLEEIPLFRAVEEWAPGTQSGDRSEIEDMPDSVEFWREVAASSENCIGQSCPDFADCFVTRMRERALQADIVIVNHHLLCADLAVKQSSYGEVIPAYDTLILDEAHLLEDVATQYFGAAVSSHRVEDLCHDVERELKAAKLDAREVRAETEGVRYRSDRLFRLLALGRGRRLGEAWASPQVTEESSALLLRLAGLKTAILALPERPESVTAVAGRAQALAEDLGFLLQANDDSHVYFVEVRGRGVYLKATPIDVSARLQELLFRTAPLRGADLGHAHRGRRLLLPEGPARHHRGHRAAAPVALRLRAPGGALRAAADAGIRAIPPSWAAPPRRSWGCSSCSRGRAFVLFTSYQNMHAVADELAGRIAFPLLMQGEAPKQALLETFRTTPGAVLLATASFWQGVDVVGEALSCVIVDKLPFASPADPVVAARIDRLRKNGGDPFQEYQVPVAVLMLKQGLGRLIRSAADRGVLAVLDSRLVERGYGRRFLQSLPPVRLIHELADAEGYLD
jgi:ATP-dependent DNA helicase DinG